MADEARRKPARPLRQRYAAAVEIGLPSLALVVMLAVIFWIRPTAMSYFGFTLLFKLSTPLVLAALAQMLIIMLGDIDLSKGAFVGLMTCVAAVYLKDRRGWRLASISRPSPPMRHSASSFTFGNCRRSSSRWECRSWLCWASTRASVTTERWWSPGTATSTLWSSMSLPSVTRRRRTTATKPRQPVHAAGRTGSLRYAIQYNGKVIASRGTVADALSCKTQRIKEARIAAKTTKVPVTLYLWKVIDTHTGKEVADRPGCPTPGVPGGQADPASCTAASVSSQSGSDDTVPNLTEADVGASLGLIKPSSQGPKGCGAPRSTSRLPRGGRWSSLTS